MKRKIASRKLKRKCIICQCGFKKGDVYYKRRTVIDDPFIDELITNEYLVCPKCKYKGESQSKRFEAYKKHCKHPITDTIWTPICLGEAAMEPDHEECMICGEWV